MGYVMLGHGALDARGTSPEMEWVAIHPGTTIQFYADSGQGLWYGSHHLDNFEQLQAPWAPLNSTHVTYNMTLYSARELWDEELKNSPAFGGHTLIRAGVDGVPDPIKMCSGTRSTCPTDPRRIVAGDRHRCDGILGQYSGEIFWLACTSFVRADKGVVASAMAGTSAGALLGADPDWQPSESDQEAAAEVNKRNVKDTPDDGEIAVKVGSWLALIGSGHSGQHVQYVRMQGDVGDGTITVHKGGIGRGAGSLDVSGIAPAKQGVVEAAIQRFSDKEINFV